MTEKKTTVDDIIGLVDCEPTDSVEEVRKLRGREDNNFYWYKKYKEVLNENEQLKQYKQAVSDVLLSYSQKNLSDKQLGLLTAIMHELGVLE